MATENRGLSTLWKTEDWLAVWVGFLIIILVLAGLTVVVPKFKWTTDGEFRVLFRHGCSTDGKAGKERG